MAANWSGVPKNSNEPIPSRNAKWEQIFEASDTALSRGTFDKYECSRPESFHDVDVLTGWGVSPMVSTPSFAINLVVSGDGSLSSGFNGAGCNVVNDTAEHNGAFPSQAYGGNSSKTLMETVALLNTR
jgi:hypothetical protein